MSYLEDVRKVACFLKDRLRLKAFEGSHTVVAIHGQFEIFGHRIEIGAKVKVMDKAVLFLAHVNKSSIETRHNLAYLADINVADTNFIARLVFMELNQLFIFQKCQLDIALVG